MRLSHFPADFFFLNGILHFPDGKRCRHEQVHERICIGNYVRSFILVQFIHSDISDGFFEIPVCLPVRFTVQNHLMNFTIHHRIRLTLQFDGQIISVYQRQGMLQKEILRAGKHSRFSVFLYQFFRTGQIHAAGHDRKTDGFPGHDLPKFRDSSFDQTVPAYKHSEIFVSVRFPCHVQTDGYF